MPALNASLHLQLQYVMSSTANIGRIFGMAKGWEQFGRILNTQLSSWMRHPFFGELVARDFLKTSIRLRLLVRWQSKVGFWYSFRVFHNFVENLIVLLQNWWIKRNLLLHYRSTSCRRSDNQLFLCKIAVNNVGKHRFLHHKASFSYL